MADTLTREAIAYGSQPLSPVPQYWNGASYEKVEGDNGAAYASIIGSAGDTARFTAANPGSVKLTATSTVVISGNATTVISGTATVNFSGSATIEVVSSAGGTAYFNKNKPGYTRTLIESPTEIIYTATITWSSGTTATSSQTLSVPILTATFTSQNIEIAITNDGPYAITFDTYKLISANATYTISSAATLTAPAEIISAGVTINSTRTQVTGLFSFNKGLTLRFTATAAFTALVTNNIFLREFN